MTKNKKLDVYYKNNQVGTLVEMPDKRVAFQYSPDWQKTGFSISPLSLPLSNEVFIPKEENIRIFNGLHGVFADSLPDAWGQLLIRNYLSEVGIDINNLSVLDRLAYVGNSGMGALEYYPSKAADFSIENIGMNFDEIASECNKILSSKDSDKLDVIYKLAGSSGGTRPKILLSENGVDWIIKFPATTDPKNSGKIEYDYSLCARKCGINMTQTVLIPSKVCEGYFKTERFDRTNGEKVFTASFAGLLNVDYNMPTCDYSTYMKLIQVLTKDNTIDKEQMYNQMCFNVLAHNRDDHTKNFSFIFTENDGWRLAPAYDVTYSRTYYGEQTTSVNGKGKNINDNDFMKVGVDAGLSKEYTLFTLERVKDNINVLEKYGGEKRKHKKIPIEDRINEVKDNVDNMTAEVVSQTNTNSTVKARKTLNYR